MTWVFTVEGGDGFTRISNHISDLPSPANIDGEGDINAERLEKYKENQQTRTG